MTDEKWGTYGAYREAARAMLAALNDLASDHVINRQMVAGGYYLQVMAAIALAEAAGIKAEG